ncbi:MAG: hypothetical protein ABWK01_02620 [Infirmifilum sp.]
MVDIECPNCKTRRPPLFNPDTGEYVCPVCGFVYGSTLEPYVPRSRDDYQRKVHSEKMLKNPDTTPRSVSQQHPFASRMLKQDMKKSIAYDTYISSIQKEFNIPAYIMEEVQRLFWKLHSGKILRGRSHKLVIATLLYTVSKKYPNVHFTREALEKIASSDIKKIYRFYRFLIKNGYIEPVKTYMQQELSQHLPVILSRLEHELKRNRQQNKNVAFFQKIPKNLIAKTAENFSSNLYGAKPNGIVAATVYFYMRLCGVRVNQDIVASLSDVSPLTIRRIIKQILDKADITIHL